MTFGQKLGLGLMAVVVGGSLLATRGNDEPAATEERTSVRAKLATVSTAARQDVDYALLDSRIQQLMKKPTMVGLAIGVVENGRITFLKGYGETLAGSGDPVTPDTVFRWASVSKGVASTMVAKLAQQGKLDLGAPVANFAPSLKLPNNYERSASVGDLLSHRLGLYRNAYDNKLEEGHDPRYLRTQLMFLNAICPPKTCWSYQNVAYDAATEMVTRATGQPYEQALKRMLFNPIGMSSASASMAGLQASKSWARPHTRGRKPGPLDDTYYKVPAAGGVNSNIKDMALWMEAQMGEMPDVLGPKLLRAVHTPYVQTPAERRRMRKFTERINSAWYGYGWRSYDYAGRRIVGHRGGINGYRSFILFDPEKKSGVVALWNSDTWQPGALEFEVMDMIHHLPFRDWMELSEGADATPELPSEPQSSGERLR